MIDILLNLVDIAAIMAIILLPFAIIIKLCELFWGERVVKNRVDRLWAYFSRGSVTDFPGKTARAMIRSCASVFGEPFSLSNLFLSFLISATLGAAGIIAGRILETGTWDAVHRTIHSLIPCSDGFYQTEYLFPFKFLCDYLTFVITLRYSEQISRRDGFFFRICTIIANIFFATLLALTGVVGIKVIAGLSRNEPFGYELLLTASANAIHTAGSFISGQGSDFDSFIFGLTALLPTSLYLSFLGLMSIVHLWDRLIHKITSGLGQRFIFVKIPVLLSLVLLIYSLAEIIEWLIRRR